MASMVRRKDLRHEAGPTGHLKSPAALRPGAAYVPCWQVVSAAERRTWTFGCHSPRGFCPSISGNSEVPMGVRAQMHWHGLDAHTASEDGVRMKQHKGSALEEPLTSASFGALSH